MIVPVEPVFRDRDVPGVGFNPKDSGERVAATLAPPDHAVDESTAPAAGIEQRRFLRWWPMPEQLLDHEVDNGLRGWDEALHSR